MNQNRLSLVAIRHEGGDDPKRPVGSHFRVKGAAHCRRQWGMAGTIPGSARPSR